MTDRYETSSPGVMWVIYIYSKESTDLLKPLENHYPLGCYFSEDPIILVDDVKL